MKPCLGLPFVIFTIAAVACSSVPPPKDRAAAIESDVSPLILVSGESLEPVSLTQRMAQLNVPGVSLAVVDGGELQWARAYGVADKESAAPVTADTLFQAASIGKPVAALAALKLVEEGQVSLDRDVNGALTSWKVPDNEFTLESKVTLRRLLNHTAGTTVWGFPGYASGASVPDTTGVLEGQGNTDAVRVWKKPGEGWRYSGGGYTVMQLLMSDVAGQPFPELMRDTVFDPLQMSRSTYEQPLPEKWRARAASGHDGEGGRVPGRWHTYPERAAAGLWTTPTDIAHYIIEVQRAYADEGQILSGTTARTMLEPGKNSHGLGPAIQDGGNRFGHGGANAGFRATFTAFLEKGSGAVVMTNSDSGGQLAQELILTIAREYGWAGMAPEEKTVVPLADKAYERLVGHYRAEEPSLAVEIQYEQGQFYAKLDEGGKRALLPESQDRFFARNGMQVEFLAEGDRVTGVELWDGAVRAKRTKDQ